MIYLASPYSHPSRIVMEHRYQTAMKVTATLMREGLHVFSPIVHCHVIAHTFEMPKDFKFWQYYNEHMISLSEALYVLRMPEWDKSAGVTGEIEIASKLEIPVHYIDE